MGRNEAGGDTKRRRDVSPAPTGFGSLIGRTMVRVERLQALQSPGGQGALRLIGNTFNEEGVRCYHNTDVPTLEERIPAGK
eukprot:CAMPEP_0171802424 /NCGR_PEP_ID=MMETSP0991-20121206/72833_1 /TAXON_ID=483369 /ORGANISM="non described non described, Strain CCMP2098" /LENGTH=80 /DNA_ID=CAMNT_0012414255 /DNA_START=124 /DNA_END=363 /DNA_ORIENTATION=-